MTGEVLRIVIDFMQGLFPQCVFHTDGFILHTHICIYTYIIQKAILQKRMHTENRKSTSLAKVVLSLAYINISCIISVYQGWIEKRTYCDYYVHLGSSNELIRTFSRRNRITDKIIQMVCEKRNKGTIPIGR